MKKWLVGCLVAGLIIVVLGCGAAYWFVWRPLSAAGSSAMSQVQDLAKIGKADEAVKNQSPFTEPADGKLSIAQVNAFVTIQQSIYDKMGADFATLDEKYKKIGNEQNSNSADPNLKDVMGAYADITKLMAKAKEAQVAAVNVQNMSLEEYRWIRIQVSRALPYIAMDTPAPDAEKPAAPADAATKAAEEAMAKAKEAAAESMKENMPGGQEMQDAMKAMGADSDTAKANAQLLRPHKELLLKTMAATWLSM